jgi:hypothetical protein
MILLDEQGIPLPKGTVVVVGIHVGVVGYLPTGGQVVGHNSKAHGKAVVSWPEEATGGQPFVYYIPPSEQHGEQAWQSVLYDVRRGVLWAWFDNCQDLVSRACTGENGSPTRDNILGGLTLLGGLAWVGREWSKPNRSRRRSRR